MTTNRYARPAVEWTPTAADWIDADNGVERTRAAIAAGNFERPVIVQCRSCRTPQISDDVTCLHCGEWLPFDGIDSRTGDPR